MNKVARKGLVTAMVAGGVLGCAGYAQADAAAEGTAAGSPGVLSGNSVQVPVNVPVNVCGNTLDVVGLLDPASGNSCANTSASSPTYAAARHAGSASVSPARSAAPTRGRHAGAPADEEGAPADVVNGGPRRPSGAHAAAPGADGGDVGGAHAAGGAHGSPGLLSGNSVLLPIDLPVNITGNSVNVVGVGNPSTGNTAVNGEAPRPPAPASAPEPVHNAPVPQTAPVERAVAPTLAHTGADGLGGIAAASAGLLLGGAVLYRRSRPGRAVRTAALAGAGAGAAAGAAA